MKDDRAPTMQDIADQAGVTRATVSMALRNHQRISLETRQRIQQIAIDMGYRPNPMVSALMANLRASRNDALDSSIAVIISREWDEWRGSPLVRNLDNGIVETAKSLGFGVDYFSLKDLGGNATRLSQVLFSRGIQGLIITSFLSPTIALSLEWKHFSAVMLDYSVSYPVLHRICNNQFHTIILAMQRVLERGYRRIGMFVQRDSDARIDHAWEAGYLLSQKYIAPKDCIPPQIVPKYERESLLSWIKEVRPEVVLGESLKVRDWMRDAQVSIEFVHLQWTPESGDCAGVDQNFNLVGAAAVEALVDMLYRNERNVPASPKTIMIEGTWRKGDALKKSVPKNTLTEYAP